MGGPVVIEKAKQRYGHGAVLPADLRNYLETNHPNEMATEYVARNLVPATPTFNIGLGGAGPLGFAYLGSLLRIEELRDDCYAYFGTEIPMSFDAISSGAIAAAAYKIHEQRRKKRVEDGIKTAGNNAEYIHRVTRRNFDFFRASLPELLLGEGAIQTQPIDNFLKLAIGEELTFLDVPGLHVYTTRTYRNGKPEFRRYGVDHFSETILGAVRSGIAIPGTIRMSTERDENGELAWAEFDAAAYERSTLRQQELSDATHKFSVHMGYNPELALLDEVLGSEPNGIVDRFRSLRRNISGGKWTTSEFGSSSQEKMRLETTCQELFGKSAEEVAMGEVPGRIVSISDYVQSELGRVTKEQFDEMVRVGYLEMQLALDRYMSNHPADAITVAHMWAQIMRPKNLKAILSS